MTVRALEDLDAAALVYAERVAAPDADPGYERDRFTRECLPLAHRLASKFRGRGEPLEDLEQVARLGLVKAVDRYDPGRGSFTAYAVSTISGELKRHFRDAAWAVHVPRPIRELLLEARHARTQMTAELSRTPTVAEVAARIGAPEAEVADAFVANGGYSPGSLDASPVSDDSTAPTLGDLLGSTDADLDGVDDKLTVSGLLMRLPARERRMLAMRFYGNRTQVEIAAELGVSQMHVSRLLSHALSWLREAMLSDTPPVWAGRAGVSAGPDLRLRVERADGAVTVRVGGEVDRDCAQRLRLCLRHAVATAREDRLVVDLSAVALLDAAGVATLVDCASAASVAEVPLAIAGAGPTVRPVLKLSGLAAILAD
ncbi:SigB/SigF/SigG family RNA polymerase sigma factor [Actinoplanes sp. NPDC051411]|uniref:SigB/SigF/SigG family RNA polymerase sigma factor n=1 Tax=Actinoplanes sp. NPDC051411 TaxID=3155522 RepID=UPI003414C714